MRLGADPNAVLDGLDDAASRCEGPVVAAFATHAHACADHDVDGMLEAAHAFQTAGWLLHAAECAADAADAAATAGLRVREREAAQLAAMLLTECGPAATPKLDRLGGRRALGTLTKREQEVALLAASGMSKREIADVLFLSVRTIGNHINHVYAKLGISCRDQLRVALDLATPSSSGVG
jgi:DNA-binding CsgD family transcriptional regulator